MDVYVYMRGTQREKGKEGFILAHASAKSRGSGWTGSRDSDSGPRTGSLFTPQLCSSLLRGNCFLSQALWKWITWQIGHQNYFQFLPISKPS